MRNQPGSMTARRGKDRGPKRVADEVLLLVLGGSTSAEVRH